ncbi:MAG: PepSY-like domain-containing protein [Prevotella sp.]|nr:PepSY-like domain-containing protein [Prevotella sp.]
MTRSVSCKANGDVMFVEQLPMSIKLFVQKNFPNLAIAYAEKKKSTQGTGYEVNLNNGTELYFNMSGNWNMIDCKSDALPVSLIPTKVFNVVDQQFTNAQLVKIVKRNQDCDIVLSNGVVLRFDMNGEVA